VLGGVLVNHRVIELLNSGLGGGLTGLNVGGMSLLNTSLLVLLLIYGIASLLNLGIPHSGARYPASRRHPVALVRDFWRANRLLWRDAEGGMSLTVTTLFWGLGATLQFVVLKWSADVLQLPLEQAAYLQTAVAVGIVAGAGMAGRWVALQHASRVLPAGVLLGLLIALIAFVQDVRAALLVLACIGVVGGLLVVPLNALLQHRGFLLLTAGRSVAVQGFNENLSVLVMLGVYAALVAADVSIVPLMTALGLAVALAMALLVRRSFRPSRGLDQ
jgi:hypothetical protein